MNRSLPLTAFALFAWLWTRESPEHARASDSPLAPDRPLATYFPERCRIHLDASGLHPLLEQGFAHPFLVAVRATPLAQALLPELPTSPEDALAAAERWLGAPALALASDLTARGLGLGFDPQTKKTVVVALGRDAERVERGLHQVFDGVERQFGWPGALDQPQHRWSGAGVWKLGEDGWVAQREALLVLGNDEELVQEVLDLAADPGARGLLDRPGFVANHERSRGSALFVWLELAELEPYGDDGLRELRASGRTPPVQALLGAELGALFGARALSATLGLEGGLTLAVRACDGPVAESMAPLARAGEVPAEPRGASTATALVYRDYARYFTQRAELFAPETLPGFAEAITNGALFFEGRDLGEEVLPALSPWIRLVARELAFVPERRPEIPLPGVALVAVLQDEREGERWAAAFQSLLAVINVDQAQKGGRSLRLYLEREGATEISAARFTTPAPAEGVDLRYNLEPALAVVGRQLVIGTHVSLVKELVRELAGSEPSGEARPYETLTLDARGLRTALEQNLELLVTQKALEEGLERSAARRELEFLRLALASFTGARLELRSEERAAPELLLALPFASADVPR
jgi:hypothetical protein